MSALLWWCKCFFEFSVSCVIFTSVFKLYQEVDYCVKCFRSIDNIWIKRELLCISADNVEVGVEFTWVRKSTNVFPILLPDALSRSKPFISTLPGRVNVLTQKKLIGYTSVMGNSMICSSSLRAAVILNGIGVNHIAASLAMFSSNVLPIIDFNIIALPKASVPILTGTSIFCAPMLIVLGFGKDFKSIVSVTRNR